MGKLSGWQIDHIFLFLLENRLLHFMQIVNLHEMSGYFNKKIRRKYSKMSSADEGGWVWLRCHVSYVTGASN